MQQARARGNKGKIHPLSCTKGRNTREYGLLLIAAKSPKMAQKEQSLASGIGKILI